MDKSSPPRARAFVVTLSGPANTKPGLCPKVGSRRLSHGPKESVGDQLVGKKGLHATNLSAAATTATDSASHARCCRSRGRTGPCHVPHASRKLHRGSLHSLRTHGPANLMHTSLFERSDAGMLNIRQHYTTFSFYCLLRAAGFDR